MDLDSIGACCGYAILEGWLERLTRKEISGVIGGVWGRDEGEDGVEAGLSEKRHRGVPIGARQAAERIDPDGTKLILWNGMHRRRGGIQIRDCGVCLGDGLVVLSVLEKTVRSRQGSCGLGLLGRRGVLIGLMHFGKFCLCGDLFDIRHEVRRLCEKHRDGTLKIICLENMGHPESVFVLDDGRPVGAIVQGVAPPGGDVELLEVCRDAYEGIGRMQEACGARQLNKIWDNPFEICLSIVVVWEVLCLHEAGGRHVHLGGDDRRKFMENSNF